jgi:hypothetical protein
MEDNPEYDATDAAHPAWWRGHDHTTQTFCQAVNDILDGKDDGHGVANEPWESVRRRLLATQSLQRRIEAAEALLRKHVDLREMQRQRESEVFHISVTTFLALWDKLDKETRKALSPPMKDSE